MTNLVQIPCIGDVHLRSAHPRNPQRLAALDQIIAAGLALPCLAAWAVVGDLFDTESTVEDRLTWAERLRAMAKRAPVFVPRGNHDPKGDLLLFGMLSTEWPIFIREDPDVITTQLATGQYATVCLFPYPEEGEFVSQGVAPAEIPRAARERHEVIFRRAGAKLETARANGDVTAFFAHANFRGAVKATGQPQGWKDIVLDTELLDLLGECPKVGGHIHNPQQIGDFIYVGSSSRNDVGEVEDKRFLVLDIEPVGSQGQKPVWKGHAQSHELYCPAIWHVETEFVKGQPFVYRWTAGPDGEPLQAPVALKGIEVRVRVKYPKSERTFWLMAQPQILADFAEAKLTIDPVCEPDNALRAPEVIAARTLAEKVAAWAKVTGTVLPDLVLDKLALLERATPDDVLAQVRREVAALLASTEEQEAAVA